MRVRHVILSVLLVGLSREASAQEMPGASAPISEVYAEYRRLGVEMAELMRKSAGGGVERKYQKMLELGITLDDTHHLAGAQAALARGDMTLVVRRLGRIQVPSPESEAIDTRLRQGWGLVSISVGPDRQRELVRLQALFAPDERAAVEHAASQLAESGGFRGFVPAGDYKIDGKGFIVRPGRDWNAIVVTAP